jgi:hypothetical protein
VARQPRPEEAERIVASYTTELRRFEAAPEAASRITNGLDWGATPATVAERAAWIMVANALLNLDETMTKE